MKIKTEQFCAIATAPSWQAWLYKFNTQIYSNFIEKLRMARNCAENREIMHDVLKQLENVGGTEALYVFLQEQFPHTVADVITNKDKHNIFPNFVPGLLTYPHRVIIEMTDNTAEKRIKKLVNNKAKSDHIIIGKYGYVEYLNISEKGLLDKIPDKNWLIDAYRRSGS